MESRINPQDSNENRSIEERLQKLADDIKKLPHSRVKQLEDVLSSMNKKTLTIKEAAKILDCHPDTVRRALQAGTLRGFQINTRGGWRVNIHTLEAFMNGSSKRM